MTIARGLPLHIHGALEAALAPLLIAAPFLFGFGVPAAITSIVVGVLLLASTLATHADERPVLPVSAHAALDVGFAAALAAAAVSVAAIGDGVGGAVLGASALLVVLIISLTRYSAGER
jgi:hypothetical protein